MTVVIIERCRGGIPHAVIRRDLRLALHHLASDRLRQLAIVFVPEAESRRLNQRFLEKRSPSNVLSFRYDGTGEIIVAPAVVRRQARQEGESYRSAVRRMVAHGLLHLLGHHHEASRRQANAFGNVEQFLLRRLGVGSVPKESR